MCIVIQNDSIVPLVAETDITVYKILTKHNDEDNYRGPYSKYLYGTLDHVIGRTYCTQVAMSKSMRWPVGGFYSYAPFDDDIYNTRKHAFNTYNRDVALFECIIPKHSRYYTDGEEYCSDQLKFIGLVNLRC